MGPGPWLPVAAEATRACPRVPRLRAAPRKQPTGTPGDKAPIEAPSLPVMGQPEGAPQCAGRGPRHAAAALTATPQDSESTLNLKPQWDPPLSPGGPCHSGFKLLGRSRRGLSLHSLAGAGWPLRLAPGPGPGRPGPGATAPSADDVTRPRVLTAQRRASIMITGEGEQPMIPEKKLP